MEDARINFKAKALENQLNQLQSDKPLFKPDGTPMSPQERTQAIGSLTDQFSSLYSNPRHAGTLMEKLRKIVAPNGGVKGGAAPEQTTPAAAMTGFTAVPPEGYAENQARQEAVKDFEAKWGYMKQYIPEDQQEKVHQEMLEKFGGLSSVQKPLTGSKPYKGADGKYYQSMLGSDGTITAQAMPPDYVPPPPTGQPKAGVSGGKNIFALETPEGWKSTLDGSILNDFRPLPNYAQVAPTIPAIRAQYEITPTTSNQGAEVLTTRGQAAAAARSGNPMLAGTIGAPTGKDKSNQMLAQSALSQINTMERVLQQDPNLTGVGAGQLTQFQRWIGTNSPDSQQFLAAATFLSEHGVGVFGGRNIHSIRDLQNLVGSWRTNPAALRAGLEQARKTMQPWATAGGRLPTRASSGEMVPAATAWAKVFGAKPGYHLVAPQSDPNHIFWQSDSNPSDIQEAKTGAAGGVSSHHIKSLTTPVGGVKSGSVKPSEIPDDEFLLKVK
jgi:hypothetical protein